LDSNPTISISGCTDIQSTTVDFCSANLFKHVFSNQKATETGANAPAPVLLASSEEGQQTSE
jgi:hypothetical protein